MSGEVAVDDGSEHVGDVGLRIDAAQLAGLDQECDHSQFSPPPSEPAKRAFLRLRVIGRIERSTVLESISIRPSSRKRVGPSQCERA
jgi:hypothetical protein